MGFRVGLLVTGMAVALSGCASKMENSGATFDRIGQEMTAATAARTKNTDDLLNQAMLPTIQLDLPESAQSVEPRFDLAVSNAPASQVFIALVSGTRYSMLVSPEVSGSLTVNLKNVTVREALETIRDMYGYEFRFQGTRIHIQSNAIQTRIFQINYLSSRRQGQSEVRVTSSSITSGSAAPAAGAGTPAAPAPVPGAATPAGTPTGTTGGSNVPGSRVSTSSDNDFWREMTQALTMIVGKDDGRSVIVSQGSGVVLVKAFPADMRAVENYLRATQAIVERQVMLEAKIIEVQLNEEFQSGVNWSWFGGASNRFAAGSVTPGTTLSSSEALTSPGVAALPGTTGAIAATAVGKGMFGLAFQMTNFAALLNFLESQGNVQVLSSPRIATINNQKAVLKVGSDEFFITNVTTTPGTVSGSVIVPGTTTITTQPFFSGIALDVTPQIDDGNNIILHVHPAISVVAEKQKIIDLGTQGIFNLPLAASTINETDSIVRVQDGNIVAIGGLMKQTQSNDRNGLPGSNGWTGQRSNISRKSELVILIKPTVIHNDSSWKEDLLNTQGRIETLDPRARPTQ